MGGEKKAAMDTLQHKAIKVVSEALAENRANIVLSVPYDIHTQSRHAEHTTAYLENKKQLRVYNPNKFTKKFCNEECCRTGYNCKKYPYNPRDRVPTDDDCWQSSYRWHCEFPEKWGHANKAAVMLCLVEDGKLGEGQMTE